MRQRLEKAVERGLGQARLGQDLREADRAAEGGDKVQVMSGKYGPYVKCGKINATLPKALTPETITLEQAIELVQAKGGAPAKAKKAPAKKAATAKKPAAKKTATVKKAPAKKAKSA